MAKQRRAAEAVDEPPPMVMEGPSTIGFGMEKGDGGHLVYRMVNRGNALEYEYLTPKRAGLDVGESKVRALARLRDAIVDEYAGPKPRRMA
jgi:hypothetical protein